MASPPSQRKHKLSERNYINFLPYLQTYLHPTFPLSHLINRRLVALHVMPHVPGSNSSSFPLEPWVVDYLLCLLHCPRPHPSFFLLPGIFSLTFKYIQVSFILSSSFYSKTLRQSSTFYTFYLSLFFLLMLHFLEIGLYSTISWKGSHQCIQSLRQI